MKLLVWAGLALAATAQPAWSQSDEALEAAKLLVVRSGLAVQIEAVPKQLGQELEQSRGQLPDEVVDAIGQAARESFRPALLQREVGRLLAGKMPAAEMRRVIAWLETDLGRRVTRAEEEAALSMTPEALLAHAGQVKRQPLSQGRIGVLAGLAAASKSTEAAANMMESVTLAMMVGMDVMQPAQNRIGMDGLKARLRQIMPPAKLRASLEEALPEIYSYTYRGTSDADLAAYLAFSRSALGSDYNDAMIAAYTEALARASLRVGQLIDAAMKRKAA